jgi:RNA polymerase sigma-70 factor (ECF subfamily)
MINKNKYSREQILLMKIGRGDTESFEEIISAHQRALMNFFYKLGADKSMVEDLAQETFLRLYRAAKCYRPEAKFTTFLYRLARNVYIDFFRKNKKDRVFPSGDLFEWADKDRNFQRDLSLDMETLLLRLSDKHREVLVMSFFLKFKYQEIADILELPLGTVRSRIHEAVKCLKKLSVKSEII